jgi:amino acid transporter
MRFLALSAATFFMVSGGPYGLEELIQKAGYTGAIFILLIVPLIWALPTGLMVGELSAAIPAEGGYYVWVRRALGPFWGFQEAWLSLMSSIFDMAAYPAVFVLALGQLWAPARDDHNKMLLSSLVIGGCLIWNLFGARAVGNGSILLGLLLLAPFALIGIFALWNKAPVVAPSHAAHADWVAGLIVAMWNYMGWDNASTIAQEVRDPQRTYPRVMLWTLVAIVMVYVLPVLAARHAGVPLESWTTGNWVGIGGMVGGSWLALTVLIATMVSTFGMLNSLMMSYARIPMVLADHGLAPQALNRRLSNGSPWASLLVCSLAWTLATGLSFDRILLLDVMLYGASLLLEFVALVKLRLTEPELARPFRVPGGAWTAGFLGVGPAVLLGLAFVKNREEQLGSLNPIVLAAALAASGVAVYALIHNWRRS